MTNNNWQVVGRILGPFGINGEMRILLDGITPEEIIKQKIPIRLDKTDDILTLKKCRNASKYLAARFEEISDRNQAETYPKSSLCIDSSYLPEQDFLDFIGFAVLDEKDNIIGNVVNFHNYGASDIFEININNKNIMIPDNEDLVININEQDNNIKVSSLIEYYIDMK